MTKLRAFLALMRPPNLLTALADILAGFAASTALHHVIGSGTMDFFKHELPWNNLILTGGASVCLYAGGVVLNDVFDAKLDRIERPERPIPSGVIQKHTAAFFGAALLVAGILLAFSSNQTSGFVAMATALLVLLYDAFSKPHPIAGPLNMGLCRGANLMLGVSIFPENLLSLSFLMMIPILYVTAITVTSRGEVHGSNKVSLNFALGLYLLTVVTVISMGILEAFTLWPSLIYLILLLSLIIPPMLNARRSNQPSSIGKAVKHAVLGLIVLNAAIAAGFAGWFFGLLLLILLPFSMLLAKLYAVT
jgi:4-hydroxybenzoate polyprenyltransferase